MDTRREQVSTSAHAETGDDPLVTDEAIFAIERVPPARGLKVAAAAVLVIAGLSVAGMLGSGNDARRVPAQAVAATPSGLGGAALAAGPSPTPREWTGVKTGDDLIVQAAAAGARRGGG